MILSCSSERHRACSPAVLAAAPLFARPSVCAAAEVTATSLFVNQAMANQQQSAEDLFEAALDLPPERMPEFLDQACRHTPEFRLQFDELLLEEERAAEFLSSPAFTHTNAAA